jgi:hypothetical protein
LRLTLRSCVGSAREIGDRREFSDDPETALVSNAAHEHAPAGGATIGKTAHVAGVCVRV